MNDRIKFLKIKIKSLAAEQGIIRLEHTRAKARRQTDLVNALWLHRTQAVRPELRHAHIAYGLLRGRTLEQIEPRAKRPYDQKKVDGLIKRFGDQEDQQRLLKAA